MANRQTIPDCEDGEILVRARTLGELRSALSAWPDDTHISHCWVRWVGGEILPDGGIEGGTPVYRLVDSLEIQCLKAPARAGRNRAWLLFCAAPEDDDGED